MGFRKSITDFIGSRFGVNRDIAPQGGGKPKSGEATGPQNTAGPAPFGASILANLYQEAGGGPLGFIGGVYPGGIPGLGLNIGGSFWGVSLNGGLIVPRKGSYGTYRLMALDPTFRLVKSLIFAPIIASEWTIQPAEGIEIAATGKKFATDKDTGRVTSVPQSAIDFLKDQILPLRASAIREALRYLEFGWRPFERVYEIGRGGPNEGRFYTLKKLKPLLPEFSQILHDGNGNFGGLGVGSVSGSFVPTTENTLPPNKAWICTNDAEAGNLYGLSRYEPGFEAWCDTQVTRQKQYLLMGKLSGIMPKLYYKPGKTVINGKEVDNYDIAKQIIAVALAGGGMAIPTTEYEDVELQANPGLAALAPWKLEIEDAGSYAPAMDGMIREREYNDKLKVRGWGWPERAALEATTAGSRADSQTHSASVSLDLKNIDDDLAAQMSSGQQSYDVPGVIDELLRLNYGPETARSIVVRPAPLADEKIDIYTTLVENGLQNPAIAPMLAQAIEWPDILDHLDIKSVDDLKTKMPALLKQVADAAKAKAQPKPSPTMVGQAGSGLAKTGTPPGSNRLKTPIGANGNGKAGKN